MIPEEARSEIIKRRAAGETWTGIADWILTEFGIEIHRTTIQRWHDKTIWEQEEQDLSPENDLDTRIKLDKKVETYKSESVFYKKLYQKSLKDAAKKEIVIDTIRELTPSFTAISPHTYKKPTGDFIGQHPQTVIAPLTDTHIGESVNEDQMVGLNTYDFKVNCMEQMIRGANLIAQALMLLAPNFKTIHIPCVVGNHGRMTRKPPMKDKYMDWDYMLYQWIAAFCKEQKNITFDIPKSFINLFSVYDNTILIMHGDSVSGGGSNTSITRAITSLRGVLQYKKNLSIELGIENETVQFDNVMIGHFHRIDEIDIGTGELHICGCMKGPDEFALQRLHTASKPKQLVTYWHPKYGYIGKEVIYLNRYDKEASMFVDVLPDVWANNTPSL